MVTLGDLIMDDLLIQALYVLAGPGLLVLRKRRCC